MSRKNIFDIIGSFEIDIYSEIIKIRNLYNEQCVSYGAGAKQVSLEEAFENRCLPAWKYRNGCLSAEEIREKLEITDGDIRYGLDEEHVLIFLEYTMNVILLLRKCKGNVYFTKYGQYLAENTKRLIESLNYEIKTFEEEQKVILVEKNPAATAVAEIVDTELAYPVIEFNHFLLKGDLQRKKQILKLLGDKFESIRKELNKINSSLESDIGFLLNNLNIRHNNMEGPKANKYVQEMSLEELEHWYDETYQMLLISILLYDNIERSKQVKELKGKIVGK